MPTKLVLFYRSERKSKFENFFSLQEKWLRKSRIDTKSIVELM
jgi:hypothetical protein